MRSRNFWLLSCVAISLLGAGKRPPGLGDVTDVRLFDHPSYSRVVIELSREAQYEARLLEQPPRLYLDIEGVWIEETFRGPREAKKDSPLAQVRGGQNTLERARIVMDLHDARRDYRIFTLKKPYRIVVDVPRGAKKMPPVASNDSTFDLRPVRRVVIDPGHGGKDPGAIGSGNIREKDVVLRVSKALRQRLTREGFEVFLTRDNDRYKTLEARTQFANRLNADLFVSIHANASPNKKTHGVETYLLDTRYDRQTARVAARENGTTIDRLNEVQKILASLRLGYNERFAARLAEKSHKSLLSGLRSNHSGTKDLGVKRGPFLVLFMADMPAILVELGFVSNKQEAKRLKTDKFTQNAARGIANGIVRYRDDHARSLVAGR